ncbi:unnamed protein product [Amaranthus hypochondriacus]
MLERFIPNGLAMNFDCAHYMLTDGSKDKENPTPSSPSKVAYLKQLKEIFHKNKTRILEFKNKPHNPVEFMPQEYTAVQSSKSIKPHKHITQLSQKKLDELNDCVEGRLSNA